MEWTLSLPKSSPSALDGTLEKSLFCSVTNFMK